MAQLIQVALRLDVNTITEQVHIADKEQVSVEVQLNIEQEGREDHWD